MSANAWLIVAAVGFSLAGIFLIISIVMFVTQDIPGVLADLSGKKRARGIAEIRSNRASAITPRAGKTDTPPVEKAAAAKYYDDRSSDKKTGTGTVPLYDDRFTADRAAAGMADGSRDNYRDRPFTLGNQFAAGGTMILDENAESAGTMVLEQAAVSAGTMVLDGTAESGGTMVLDGAAESGGTMVLDGAAESTGTTVLNATTLLSESDAEPEPEPETPVRFEVIRSVVVIHTDEVIR